jgi:hypothetical protein
MACFSCIVEIYNQCMIKYFGQNTKIAHVYKICNQHRPRPRSMLFGKCCEGGMVLLNVMLNSILKCAVIYIVYYCPKAFCHCRLRSEFLLRPVYTCKFCCDYQLWIIECSDELPLSYTILLEDLHGGKKWSQKHGGFRPLLTQSPWQLVRISHGNYHWPGSDLSPLEFPPLPPWYSLKNFRFFGFCSIFSIFESIFKMFSRSFFQIWLLVQRCASRTCYSSRERQQNSNLAVLAKYEQRQSQRGYLNQRAINRYFIQFLNFIYALSYLT